MRAPTVALLLVAALISACRAEDHSGAVPVWEVAAAPALAVGDRVDGDSVVFASVADARLLDNGLLVVADAGAHQVVVFDRSGGIVHRAGRRGRGPSEFTGAMTLASGPADSAAIWDPGQTRWTLLDARTGGMRNLTESLPRPIWLYAGILIHSALAEPPAWVSPLLRGLSAASDEVRLAHLDELGALWVSQDAAQHEWLIYTDSVAPVGSVTLPDGLKAFQFRSQGVVGLQSDSLGLEQVVLYAIERRRHEAADRTPGTPLTVDPNARSLLMATLRNAVMAQEMHWMTAESYTGRPDSLALEVPPVARFKILDATKGGWRGVAWYPETGYTCLMVVGLSVPAGFGEGEVGCGWGRVQ